MKTLVIAPHADDELLGCGGTLLRRKAEGGSIGWLLMTSITEADGWSSERVSSREMEIEKVRLGLGVSSEHFFELGFTPAKLDDVPLNNIIEKISNIFNEFKPDEIMLPHPGDVHSDHRVAFESTMACTKWFRYPSIRRVMTYETLSETDFGIDPRYQNFSPNTFVDISKYIDKKLELLSVYESEMRAFPFPRSKEGISALAKLRGIQSGFLTAEGFCILRERF